MILSKTGYFETLNPISKNENVLLTLKNIGKVVLPVSKQFKMRGSRCLLGSGDLVE